MQHHLFCGCEGIIDAREEQALQLLGHGHAATRQHKGVTEVPTPHQRCLLGHARQIALHNMSAAPMPKDLNILEADPAHKPLISADTRPS